MEPLGSPDPKTPTEIMKFSVPQSCILEVPDTLSTSFGDVMKKDLKISCSLCRHSLGLEENNYIVPCSLMSLSKVHLVSIWKGDLEKPVMGPTSVVVMVSDITSVDTRIWERSPEQGIWSKEDGCVFNKILCTFCSNQENCLGLHVVATGSSNVQFLNKALFYCDRLEIQHIDVSRNKEVSPSSVTSGTKSLVQIPSVRPETNSGGWRSTKSKMQLPKKSPNFICKTLMPNQSVNFKLVFMTIMIDFEDSISNGKMTVTMTMTKRMSLGSMFIFNSGDVCFELKDLSKRSSNVVYSQLYFIIVILH
ncbi:hypothetical protein L1987_24233 [Smallanthus sonchifolius]|uniref:Uncharacterized protein n=1 Tax=Smallanthus sonchifolius TaxID=185202 RepID=A0ACB9IJ49_9ASTR|nr:hypothetical protein L1987_24233 [Smallanthus sonchifolius]